MKEFAVFRPPTRAKKWPFYPFDIYYFANFVFLLFSPHVSYILLAYVDQPVWLELILSATGLLFQNHLEIILDSKWEHFKNHKAQTELCNSYKKSVKFWLEIYNQDSSALKYWKYLGLMLAGKSDFCINSWLKDKSCVHSLLY